MVLFARKKEGYDPGVLWKEIKSTTDTNRYNALFIKILRPHSGRTSTRRLQRFLSASAAWG